MLAYGTMNGTLNIISKEVPLMKNFSRVVQNLRYPGDTASAYQEVLKNNSSDWIGDGRFWGRTKPVIDMRLLNSSQGIDGLFYSRNDRGILPNQVHVFNHTSASLSMAESYGIRNTLC